MSFSVSYKTFYKNSIEDIANSFLEKETNLKFIGIWSLKCKVKKFLNLVFQSNCCLLLFCWPEERIAVICHFNPHLRLIINFNKIKAWNRRNYHEE